MADPRGYLSLILHAHLPYVRHPELPEFLEESWLFEALTESYLPLLIVFKNLLRDRIDFRLAMSVTPTLAAMLEDPLLRERYRSYLDRMVELAEREADRQRDDPTNRETAEIYLARFQDLRAYYNDELQGDVAGAWRRLQEAGKIELLASAATHAVLPLLRQTPSAVAAQVRIGIEQHRKLFHADPAGFWLPECAYYPGLDQVLAENGIRYCVLETHGVLWGSTTTTYGAYAPVACPSGVAAFARDPDSSKQVWSARDGYPGHSDYRDFYRDIGFDLPVEQLGRNIGPDQVRIATGMKYHRITGRETSAKEPYVRRRALEQAARDAADFLECRVRQVEWLAARMDRRPIVVAPYDAELFGHWWFEGPEWLELLFRKARDQDVVAPVTPSEYLAENTTAQVVVPAMSSWGKGGCFETWVNESTSWIYPPLHRAARIMEDLADRHRGASGPHRRALDQAARELLLAQASDWPFILHAGTSTVYATRRLREHLDRFASLAEWAERGSLSPEEEEDLGRWESAAPIFPEIRFEAFLDGRDARTWALPREPRRVAFLAAEGVPFVKVGGLADVIGALPRALAENGLDVVVILPGYASINRRRHGLEVLRDGLTVEFAGRAERFRILKAPSIPRLDLLFIDHPGFFGREGIYVDPGSGSEYPDTAERFIFFTRAALEALRVLGEPVDVVHCHDHHTALVPAYLKRSFKGDAVLGHAASVFTIHNLGYQGVCDPAAFAKSGLMTQPLAPGSPFEHRGQVNLLKAGITLAHKVNVVSEGYAREICTDPLVGAGLEQVLIARGTDLAGILNGIDLAEWNPADDPHLPASYDASDVAGKRTCRKVLREKIGFQPADRPLVGMITRLVDQKGLDLICDGLERILDLGVDLVILGTGLPKYQDYLNSAAGLHPGRLAILLKFDNAMAHLIEAGADMFLMPSLYEPCGLNQMYSLRYGTVPVVRATGGLADTVIDDDEARGAGNGFSFKPYSTDALLDALRRAVAAFRSPGRWPGIVRRAMTADHSWDSSAGRYVDLYRDALEGS